MICGYAVCSNQVEPGVGFKRVCRDCRDAIRASKETLHTSKQAAERLNQQRRAQEKKT